MDIFPIYVDLEEGSEYEGENQDDGEVTTINIRILVEDVDDDPILPLIFGFLLGG